MGNPASGVLRKYCPLSLMAVLAIWVILDVFTALSASSDNLVCRFEDDAFFYATISRHAAEEGIISFDGVSATNGFHPLWMGILIATRSVVPDQICFLRAVSVLSSFLLFLAGIIVVRTMSRQYSSVVVLLVLLLLLRYLRDFAHLAMETSILIPLAMLALVLLDGVTRSTSIRSLLVLGGVLALVGLARVDAALLAVLTGIWAMKQNGRLSAAIVFLPGAVAGILLLVANKLFFGSWMSVSGGIKASGAGLNTLFAKQLFLLSDPMGLRSPWGLFLLFFALSFVILFIKRSKPSIRVVSVFLILFTISQLFLSRWRLWFWYAYPAVLFCAFCLPFLLQKLCDCLRIPKRLLNVSSAFLLLLSILLAVLWGWHYGGENPDDFRVRNMHIAEELNSSMGDSVLIAIGDRAGSFAYFFRGGVVQMEGLAGSVDLAESIQQKRLQEYLLDMGVDYVVSWTGPGNTEDYTSWDLLVPDIAQSLSLPNRVTVHREDELQRWAGATGTVILWRFDGRDVVR
ncbi:MAG: hypothetical protein GQ565_08340 [Candidatus Aegiribacteria sp.]|nr:hypothetical protein [Candidatus Aegiribacteria sp.]